MAIMSPQPTSGEADHVKPIGVDGEAMDIDPKVVEEKKIATEKDETTNGNTNGNGVNGGSPPLSTPSLSPLSVPTGQANTRQLSELHITSPDAISAVSPTDTSQMNDVIMKDSFEEKKQPIEEKKQANEEKKPKPKAAEPPKDRTAKEKSKETKETPNVKVSRSREEDEHVAPPSKRARTEESQDGDHSGRASGTGLTKPQHRYAISLLRNIKRTKDAGPFLYPVDHEALNIPTYPEIIKHPMDISTIESKLNHNEYANTDQFIADFNLMIENCYTFNGPEHPVAHMANAIRIVFEKGIKQMPAAERHEPPTPEKKHTPTTSSKKKASSASKKPTTQSAAPATPAAAATATSSKKDNPKPTKKKSISVAPSTQTFAVGPSGIPLIRRESAASDRPKREIHPPPPRDLPYDVKPRRKKVATELKFCDLVLRELLKRQHQGFAFVFYSPVDPVALNIPDYFKIIRKPMDLQTIGSKLKTNQYNSAQEFEQDVRLMLSNCFKFNPPGSVVHGYGKKVEEIFNAKWKEKAAYIQANTSQDSPASASPVPEEEVMSEEEEEPVEDESKIKLLEKQLAEMQEQLTLMKKKGSKAPKESSSKKSKTAQRPSISQPVPAKKSTSSKKSTKKEEKQPLRQLTVEEKYELSEKINSLPPNKLVHVTKLIRDNMELADETDDELELDMEDLPNEVLHKLRAYVNRQSNRDDTAYKPVRPEVTAPSPPPAPAPAAAAPQTVRPKKNKPMSAVEQEAKIATLQAKLNSFKGGNPPGSMGERSFAENNDDSSDDEESGSSEEE